MTHANAISSLKAEIQEIWSNPKLSERTKIKMEMKIATRLAKTQSHLFLVYLATNGSWRKVS